MRVTGILLVGGASRRFGSPKALARIGDETLAERAWRALEWCDERLAFGKAGELELPFPVLHDDDDVRAPIAGVVAGLRAARNDVCVVLPVDCAWITAKVLQQLARACADAAVPQTGPLPGAYAKTALPVLEEQLARRELALHAALARLDARVVEVDPDVVADADTPSDLLRRMRP